MRLLPYLPHSSRACAVATTLAQRPACIWVACLPHDDPGAGAAQDILGIRWYEGLDRAEASEVRAENEETFLGLDALPG